MPDILGDLKLPKALDPRENLVPIALIGGGGFYYLGSIGKLPAALQKLWDAIFGAPGVVPPPVPGIPSVKNLAYRVNNLDLAKEASPVVVKAGDTIGVRFTFDYRGPAVPAGATPKPGALLPAKGAYVSLRVAPSDKKLLWVSLCKWGQRSSINLALPAAADWKRYSVTINTQWNVADPKLYGSYRARAFIRLNRVKIAKSQLVTKAFEYKA